MAGAVEVVIQSFVRENWLDDPNLFAQNFEVPLSDLVTISDRDLRFLNDASLALLDEENISFMDKKTRLRFFCLRAARKLQSADGINEYSKPLVYPDSITRYLFASRYNALFEKHFSFRTWSRWDTVLFLPIVPNTMFLLGKNIGEDMLHKEIHMAETSYCRSQRNRFQKYIKGVFMFKALKKFFQGFGNIRNEMRLFTFFFRIVETIVEMVILVIPLFFIFFFLLILILSIYNLFRDSCISISAIF